MSKYDSVPDPNEDTKGFKRDLGKIRMDLIDPGFICGLGKVLTYGSEKYDSNKQTYLNNWRGGMRWGRVYAALQRHLQDFWNGEDFDSESGLHHLEHAAFNIMSLHYYWRRFPQGDDRDLHYRNIPRIGLDVDGTICDTYPSAVKRAKELGLIDDDSYLNDDVYHYELPPAFKDLFVNGEFDKEFYLNLPPIMDGKELKFEPSVYLTARTGIAFEVLEKWLYKNGFPYAPIISIGLGGNKGKELQKFNIGCYVEDNFNYFRDIEDAGIACFILDQPYNRKYDVGSRRIFNINEILDRIRIL